MGQQTEATAAKSALVISPWLEGWFMPALFTSAGMHCDVVTACSTFAMSQHIRQLSLVQAANELAPTALDCWQTAGPYEWVVSMNDSLLGELGQRALLDPAYRVLLPLTPGACTKHLHSKIGLSRSFSMAGIPTPDWRVAQDPSTALVQAKSLGYPLLVKQDASAGGKGVWSCNTEAELTGAAKRQSGRSFLLQKKVAGSIFSVEALFHQSELKAYALSKIEGFEKDFGPSTCRLYGVGNDIPNLDERLKQIGRHLGIHGFTNISLVHNETSGKPEFFECDVRPNAWLHLDKALGDDFSEALRHCIPAFTKAGSTNRKSITSLNINQENTSARSNETRPLYCYKKLTRQKIKPFIERRQNQIKSRWNWKYPPPNENPMFLKAVVDSGQLTRKKITQKDQNTIPTSPRELKP